MFLLAARELKNPDYFIIITYFVIMVAIGLYFYRRMRVMKDFFSGSNNITWWLSGVSFYMSCFSAFGFVVYSALAYEYGWLPITLFWTYIPAALLGGLVFGIKWRRARLDSPVEYLETRFGATLRQFSAWQGLPVKIIDDALKIVAIGIFLSSTLGLPLKQSMIWSAVVILLYTFMGGLWAVTTTDFIQFIVMLAAIVLLFPLSLHEVGGVREFIQNSPKGFFRLTGGDYNLFYIGCMIFMYSLSMSSVHWQLIQRYTCVPTERDVRKVSYMVVALCLITPIIMYVPAMAARQFLPADTLPKEVYPLLCLQLLPTGLLGLTIAAMLAATMSMLSSDYNVVANVMTNDVYRRFFRPDATQRELLTAGRIATLITGLLALGVALLMVEAGGEDLFKNMVQLFSVFTAPIAFPMILGILTKKITNKGSLYGYLAGIITGLILFFALPKSIELFGWELQKENVILLATSSATVLVMIITSALTTHSAKSKVRIDDFFEKLNLPLGKLPGEENLFNGGSDSAISPFRIVGFAVVAIGLMMLAILPWIESPYAFKMDIYVALALIVAGILMVAAARRKPAA
jgi:solute:Na+ symporter, SSS family